MNHRLLTWGGWIARLAVGLALGAWIVKQLLEQPFTVDPAAWSPRWPLWMAGGHLLFFGAYLAGIARWGLLMQSHAIRLGWNRLFRLFFIGHFFNAFMLGATGGDMVKAWMAARESRHRKTEAATLVFLDRLIGLIALIALVVAALSLRLRLVLAHPSLARALLLMGLLLAGALVLLAVFARRNPLDSALWNRLSRRLPGSVTVHARRVYDAVYEFRRHPGVLVRTFLLSLGVHVLSLLACLLFARAAGVPLSLFHAFTLFPLLGALGSLPVTPGGFGFREAVSVVLFGAIGIAPGPAFLLSLLPHLSILLWSLFGGIFYLLEPAARRASPRETELRD